MRTGLRLNLLHQLFKYDSCRICQGMTQRRQRGIQIFHLRNIIKPNHGYIIRYP